MKINTSQLQICISPELKEKVMIEANKKGLKMGTFVKFIILEYFNKK